MAERVKDNPKNVTEAKSCTSEKVEEATDCARDQAQQAQQAEPAKDQANNCGCG